MSEEKPKIRPLEFLPIQGRQQFLLRDPSRLSTQEIIVPMDKVFLLSHFDGTNTVREAQVGYVRRFGTLLTTEKIQAFLQQLDEALFLDSPRFAQLKAQLEAEFRAQPTRPMTHAGHSYEADSAAFARTWQTHLDQAELPNEFALDAQRPLLLAPHYEMNQAADCFAAAYRLLAAAASPPEIVIILGVAHAAAQAPFILTRKAFETPFGKIETDEEITTRLTKAAPFDLFTEEFLHRDEHSIEFQAVLSHFLYRKSPPRIIPLLCGPFHRKNTEVADPKGRATVVEFLDNFRTILSADPRPIAVIASVDFSHIGTRFGQAPITQSHLQAARRHDTALVEKASAGDADGLFQILAQSSDRFNICGFPAIYTLLSIASVTSGRLLSYRQAVEPASQSAVSFAAVGLK